jgi:hypothetical protein
MILLLVCVMPGASSAAPPEIPKPRAFPVWYIQGDHGKTVIVGMVLREIGGKLAICGAGWPEDGRFDTTATQERFRRGTIKVEGKATSVDLNVVQFHATREEARTFRCGVTDRLWKDSDKDAGFKWKSP